MVVAEGDELNFDVREVVKRLERNLSSCFVISNPNQISWQISSSLEILEADFIAIELE